MKTIWIKNNAFKNIVSGRKLIEGRLNKGIFKSIKLNEIITLKTKEKSCKVKIINIDKFNNFNEMLNYYSINTVLPDKKDINDGVLHYLNIYKQKDIDKYNVLGLQIKLI